MVIMYYVSLVILALLKNTTYGAVILATVMLLLVFSLIKVRSVKVRSGWRSLWCFLVNSLPWVILVAGFLLYGTAESEKMKPARNTHVRDRPPRLPAHACRRHDPGDAGRVGPGRQASDTRVRDPREGGTGEDRSPTRRR